MYCVAKFGRHKIHARAGKTTKIVGIKKSRKPSYPHRHFDAACVLATDGDVEEHDREGHGGFLRLREKVGGG